MSNFAPLPTCARASVGWVSPENLNTQLPVQPVDGSGGDDITHTILHPSRWSITTPQAWVRCLTSTVVRAFNPIDLHILKSFQSPSIRVNCRGDRTLGSSLPACPPVVCAGAKDYKWGQHQACQGCNQDPCPQCRRVPSFQG